MIWLIWILSGLVAFNAIVMLLIAIHVDAKPSTITALCATFALNVFIGGVCLFIGRHPTTVGRFETYSAKATNPWDDNVVAKASNGQTYNINNVSKGLFFPSFYSNVDDTVRVATKEHKAGSTGYEITVPDEHTKKLLGNLAPAPQLTVIHYEKAKG